MNKIFKKLFRWVNELIDKFDNKIDKLIPVAVNVVQAVKKAIESETFDIVKEIVKSLVPSTADFVIDKAVEIAKQNIPKLAIQLEIIKSISNIDNNTEQLQEALIALKDVFGIKWETFCTGLAQEILVVLSDGKVTWAEAAILSKRYYDEYVKPKNN